jgi:hypothetical protein
MSVIDLRDDDVTAAIRAAVDAPFREQGGWRPVATHPSHRMFWIRMAVVAGLTALAYMFVYSEVLADALSGSRTAFLVVVPVLLLMIAVGYRTPPRGVGDAESDWILAALIGAACFAAIHLVSERLPTLSGLWRLPMLGALVWFACVLTVMFGVRHVVRMWGLWLFALCCVTPLPFLLTTAAFGGSDTAAVLVAAAFGAVAVVLAGRAAPRNARIVAGLGCYVAAAVVVLTPDRHTDLLVTTVLAAGVVPVLATAILLKTRSHLERAVRLNGSIDLPRRSALSVVVLTLVAAMLMLLHPSTGHGQTTNSVASDWIERSAMGTATSFSFITRYFGEDSRLDRYLVPTDTGMPAAAIDVITTGNRAALEDFADAVWYPSSRPVEYRPAEPSEAMPLGARVIHSNADAATNGVDAHWYAVTWVWTAGSVHQRVTVIVNQTATGDQPPPEPAPLSLLNTSLRPALWVARQQPVSAGQVDELVTRHAADLVARINDVARHRDEGPTDA